MYHCRALFIFLSGRRQGDIVPQISLRWSLHIFTGSSPDHCLALSANKIFFDKKVKRSMGIFDVSSTLLSLLTFILKLLLVHCVLHFSVFFSAKKAEDIAQQPGLPERRQGQATVPRTLPPNI